VSGGVANTVGLGPRRLEPAEFLDDFVEQHDDIAIHEEAIESIGVLDECRGVGDINGA